MSNSCNSNAIEDNDENKDVLLIAGDEILTLRDVLCKIPVGLEPADSSELFQVVIDNWIKEEVLSTLAKRKLPDLSDIESKVETYRNQLIVAAYLKEMKKGQKSNIASERIRSFYEQHKNEMLTESPLIKGIYIRIATGQHNLDEIRKLVFCGNDDCVDRLEKYFIGDALQYDYFQNDWVDWQTVVEQIPYRFYDPDAFLKSTCNFETSFNGSVYLLHISEFLPSGSVPPYEFAAIQIKELLERVDLKKFEDSLVKSLIKKAVNDGELVGVGYDPIERTIVPKNSIGS
ncbi:MAG: hypothetical protein HDR88_09110 [Bacteroides sp.]|nr:hypothetical protein [Bacteroides sp.]